MIYRRSQISVFLILLLVLAQATNVVAQDQQGESDKNSSAETTPPVKKRRRRRRRSSPKAPEASKVATETTTPAKTETPSADKSPSADKTGDPVSSDESAIKAAPVKKKRRRRRRPSKKPSTKAADPAKPKNDSAGVAPDQKNVKADDTKSAAKPEPKSEKSSKTTPKVKDERAPKKATKDRSAKATKYGAQKTFSPTGYVGPYEPLDPDDQKNFVPIPNRWLLPYPEWNRHSGFRGEEDSTGLTYEYPYTRGGILDPYEQNILKGDYPVIGNDIFFAMTLISDTVVEQRRAPTPSGISARQAFSEPFFGDDEQNFFAQTFITTFELFKGDTAFKPRDWEIRGTVALNMNYLDLEENNGVNIDVRDRSDRFDYHFGLQELFYEYHIGDLSDDYDFWTVRAGVQGFVSDFRGFLYSENQPGVRFSGSYFANRLQWNLAGFYFLEKDTNSGLNELKERRQTVLVANLIWQDAFKEILDEDLGEGFTLLFSYHFNRDNGSQQFDENGFNVRPGRFGRTDGSGPADEHTVSAHYLGIAGEGHIGRFNLTFEYFWAFGRDSKNPIAGRAVDISAHFLMVEPSVDFDWLRIKANFLYQSGDGDPESSRATGFDTIVDNPNFAGSEDSFYQRQSIVLPQTTVLLNNRFSFLNSFRTAKNEGQANFVNPGLILMGGGVDMNISPRFRIEANVNYLMFDRPEAAELLVFQREVARDLGVDYNLGLQYRPFLTDNVIVNAGFSVFKPLEGFGDLYEERNTLYSTFVELVLVY